MHKLIIYCSYEPMAQMKPSEVELDEDYTESQAELRALRWLMYRPDDLVMLISSETAICMHCGLPIEEAAGWIHHKWVHRDTGGYTCRNRELTKATPREDL